ncbi:MAG: glycosyltransferase [Alphaproteobacteria bacterium]|nr:glycosyltransferase [Alphaproteobacteria bacterium]
MAEPARRNPIRVLHVIAGLETGGAETMLAALVAARPPALEQSVVAMVPGGAQADRIAAAGIPLRDLGMRRGRPDPRAILRLARAIRTARPDVVQSWMYHADLAATLALPLSGLKRQVRHAWNLRCSDMADRDYGRMFHLVRGAWLRLAGSADLLVANSQAGLDYHRGLGLRAPAVRVIPNGIDTARFRPDPAARASLRRALGLAPDATVLIHVARVDPMKDHATLLAALAQVPGATLLLVGRGTERLAAPPRVLGLGERADVPALLAAGDLAVSSSAYGEGFSNALAEAMAAGLPAVATDVGDARLILGDTGQPVPPRDPAGLARALNGLLAEPAAQRAARGAAARLRVEERFALAACIQRFVDTYLELSGKSPRR